jgi:glycerol-3-phosphate dehydrogenase
MEFPIYNLIGGKWTSFRVFSEEVTDKTLSVLDLTRKISTRNLPIGGGLDYPKTSDAYDAWIHTHVEISGLHAERIKTLFERYGTHAAEYIKYITSDSDAPLAHLPDYTQREIKYIAKNEKIVHLDDFLLRRSMLAKLGLLSLELINEIANVIGSGLEWPPERKDEEIERSLELLRERHGVHL